MKYLYPFLILALLLLGCDRSPGALNSKPVVVTSIPPYAFLVKSIVGDRVEVNSATGGDFEPHTSEITPSQMKVMQHADLFIGIGEPYEKNLLNAMNQGKRKLKAVALDQTLSLLTFGSDTKELHSCSSNDLYDRHIWLSPEALIPQVSAIVQALSQLTPDGAEEYQKNGEALTQKLSILSANLHQQLEPFQNRSILISHPALGYFCHEFQIEQISVECEGKEPLPGDLSRLLTHLEQADLICVFVAPQFHNKGAELLAKQLKLRVEKFDPLQENPLATIQEIADSISENARVSSHF